MAFVRKKKMFSQVYIRIETMYNITLTVSTVYNIRNTRMYTIAASKVVVPAAIIYFITKIYHIGKRL